MREMGLTRVVHGGHKMFTTTSDDSAQRREGLVQRNFTALEGGKTQRAHNGAQRS